jgi:phosphoribosylformylglycinamidine synthase subunit PurS
MKFVAEIDVMPQKEILDPQGKAVKLGLNNLGVMYA